MSRKLWFLNTAVNETENDKAEYAARESNVVNIANANKEMVDVLKVPVAKYTDGNDTLGTDHQLQDWQIMLEHIMQWWRMMTIKPLMIQDMLQ